MHLLRSSRYLLFVLLFPFYSTTAISGTPAEDFESDDILNSAIAEVLKFNSDQLNAFIDYLASCGSSLDSAERNFACQYAQSKLEVKTGNSPSLKRLIAVVEITDQLVTTGWNTATSERRKELARYIKRKVDIFWKLKETASKLYVTLAR